MGLGDFFNDFNKTMLGPTGGLGSLLGMGDAEENLMAKIPVVNALTGAQSDTQKALLKKQEQLAAEAKQQQERNAKMRMQALGQSMLAFNPQNQMMAQMFGPQAAFSPQQFGQMASDPGAMSAEAFSNAREQSLRTGQPMGVSQQDMQRMRENEARKRQIAQQMTPLGPGPAPLRLPAPQQSRRF